jgi:hypothetical protein
VIDRSNFSARDRNHLDDAQKNLSDYAQNYNEQFLRQATITQIVHEATEVLRTMEAIAKRPRPSELANLYQKSFWLLFGLQRANEIPPSDNWSVDALEQRNVLARAAGQLLNYLEGIAKNVVKSANSEKAIAEFKQAVDRLRELAKRNEADDPVSRSPKNENGAPQGWQNTLRALREEFLLESRKCNHLHLAIASFPSNSAYEEWFKSRVDRIAEATADSMTSWKTHGDVWGDSSAVDRFVSLAISAGNSLPVEFRLKERLFPPRNALSNINPDPVTVWKEFVFLQSLEQFVVEEDWPCKGSRIASTRCDPFLLSAMAINGVLDRPAATCLAEFLGHLQIICRSAAELAAKTMQHAARVQAHKHGTSATEATVKSAENGKTVSPNAAKAGQADSARDEQYVTLNQAASLVNRSKKTLERYLKNRKYKHKKMPTPCVKGTGGKPHEWRWSVLRPWLEKEFGRKLPERFPR